MSACPDKLLLIHGLADGEVDAVNAIAIEAHLASCEGCRAELERIVALRAKIKGQGLRHEVPEGLRSKIETMLATGGATGGVVALRPRSRGMAGHVMNWRWASGALTGLAAGLVLMIAIPRPTDLQGDSDLVAGHVRSLMAHHLTDVEASDKHVVKPWFNGRINFAPPVPDLVASGFPLAGGRLDYIEGREVAALVYHRRLHVINVFVAPATPHGPRLAGDETKDGYNILRWSAGDLDYSAVSDLNAKEMRQFRQLFIAAAAG